jgi:membrane-bound serine protease (ClpP class)
MGVSWSAGALIAFSCTGIYMAAGTSMGAAAPVLAGPDGSAEAAGEKTVAAVRSQIAALAERNGHPPGIALAMVDFDVELWEVLVDGRVEVLTLAELERLEKAGSAEGAGVNGSPRVERRSVISPAGKLLSLTAGEAYRYGLSEGIADDREALFAALGAAGMAGESSPGVADGVITFLNSGAVQAVLIILGLVMIFLEINTPGFGIPGVVGIIAFILVFGSGALLGRVDSPEIILFLLGVGLLAVEIFILPGFGVMGISGILFIGLSLVLSMQDFVVPRFDWEWNLLGRNAVVVAVSILASVTGIVIIALLGPKIRLFDRLTLKSRIMGTAGGPDHDAHPPGSSTGIEPRGGAFIPGEPDYSALVGKQGIAVSTLRPAGKAEIEGQVFPVEGEGVFIAPGAPVQVIRVYGNRIIVKDCGNRT